MRFQRLFFWLFIATFALSCKEEDAMNMRELKFEGVIRNGDTGSPAGGIKVLLRMSISGPNFSSVSIEDSVITDGNGKYATTIRYNRDLGIIWQYHVDVGSAYYETCSEDPPIFPMGPFSWSILVDTLNTNTFDFYVCPTWEIKISATKQNPGQLDTLSYVQDWTAPPNNYFLSARSYITEDKKEDLLKFFSAVTKTRILFRIKRQDGSITEWDQEVLKQPKQTQTITVNY